MMTVTTAANFSDFDRLIRRLEDARESALDKAALDVQEQAQLNVAIDTGQLFSTIKVKKAPKVRFVSAGEGLPDDRAFWQEFGNSITPAQPYLFPAAFAVDIENIIAQEIKKVL